MPCQRPEFFRHSMKELFSPTKTLRRNGGFSFEIMVMLLFGLLFFIYTPASAVFICPESCTCSEWKMADSKVQNITCSSTGLTTVPSDGKEGADVITLDLSYNQITLIAVDAFQYFTNLVALDLSYNDVRIIFPNTFLHLTSLRYLNLAHLSLSILDPEWFINMANLQELYMGNNNITNLPANAFKDLAIKEIDLSNNMITSVSSNFLNGTDQLASLDLSYNKISILDATFLLGAPRLETLSLSYNQLSSIPENIFNTSVLLQTIRLDNNQLTSLYSHVFDNCSNLVTVDLSSNSIAAISVSIFAHQPSINVDLSNNPFTCSCQVRNFLYAIRNNVEQVLLNEDLTICTDSESVQHVFLDYSNLSCSGNLGAKCTLVSDCLVRNGDCDSMNKTCVCLQQYYDNNGITVAAGLCKPKVQLDYSCDQDEACDVTNAECQGTPTKRCLCKANYYDTNPVYLGGECLEMLELGGTCSMDSMCNASYSVCGSSHQCECHSSYYDSDGASVIGGTCLLKFPLYFACNDSYQCAPSNSECRDNTCTCSDGFYDFNHVGTCHVPKILYKRDGNILKELCKLNSIPTSSCGLANFFTCYPDNSTTTSQVGFSDANTVKSSSPDLECKEYCFQQHAHHYMIQKSTCLCGNVMSSSSCCPLSSSSGSAVSTITCNGLSYLGPTTVQIQSGINISYVPQLYVGSAHQFSVATTLSFIDQIRWNFGDTETELIVNGNSDQSFHTYTHSGLFWVNVSVCMQLVNICDSAVIPVRVQVPPDNLTTWINGYPTADVSKNLTDIYTTFTMGYDFDYSWARTEVSSGTISKKKGCQFGWVPQRYRCMQLSNGTATFSLASTLCSTGTLLQIDFLSEVTEIISALGLTGTSQTFILGAQRVGGMWKWKSDGSKTVFSDSNLEDKTQGDCVVIKASTATLTTYDCSQSTKYVCMTEPVSCPKGGDLHTNNYCYVLASKVLVAPKTWQAAQSYCQSQFGGWLANITSTDVQTKITSMLTMNSISEAWFGLSDQGVEGYYTWSDTSSFDLYNADFKPNVTSNTGNCFVLSLTNSWYSTDCTKLKDFVCQYSEIKKRVTVPSFVVGTADLEITSGDNIQQILPANPFVSASAVTDIILFPGWSFTKSGYVRSWVFHSANISGTYDIAIQVYRPSCTSPKKLVQPGCAGTLFSTCASTSPACIANTCGTDQFFCYLSSRCKFFNQTCTCNSESSVPSAVTACSSIGTDPTYTLIGQTQITIMQTGEKVYTVPAGDIAVQEYDVIGIQTIHAENVIKCQSRPSDISQQTTYVVNLMTWLTKLDLFPINSKTVQNQSCLLKVIYTQDLKLNLPQNIGYTSKTGNYSLSVAIMDTDLKRLLIMLDESVEDISWIFPAVSLSPTSNTSLGTVYTEWNKAYEFTVAVRRGIGLVSTWSIDPVSTIFTSSCSAAVAAAVGSMCNSSIYWTSQPFTSLYYNTSSIGEMNVEITFINKLGSTKRMVTIQTQKAIVEVVLTLVNSSLITNCAPINQLVEFQTSVTGGTGYTFSYAVSGLPVSENSSVFHYTFPSIGTYVVNVSVTNIVGTRFSAVTLYVKQPAQFANCMFIGTPYIAAKDVPFPVQFCCNAAMGSEVSMVLMLSDTLTNITSAISTVNSSPYTWSQNITFSTVQTGITITAVVLDPFEWVSLAMTVDVYNRVSSVQLIANVTDVLPSAVVSLTASVSAIPGNYGNVTYKYTFGDGITVTNNSSSVTHSYSTSGNYTVTVTAANGPSSATATLFIKVYDPVAGLTLAYNGPSVKNNATTFTAAVTSGNFLHYQFSSALFNVTSTSTSFTYIFTSAGDYNVTIVCSNALSQKQTSLTAYILEITEIRVIGLKINNKPLAGCIESGVIYQYSVDVIHYDLLNVKYDWNFGNNISLKNETGVKNQGYTNAGNFSVNVTAKYAAQNAASSLVQVVCVQQRISIPTLSLASPVGLPYFNPASKNVTVSVATGSPLSYNWSTNATATYSTTDPVFPVEFTAEGFYFITVVVSNEINSVTVTKEIEVMEEINSLEILCPSCVNKTDEFYVQINMLYSFSVMVASGKGIAYSWNFGDSSVAAVGMSNSHTYAVVGTFNLTVTATNPVSPASIIYKTVHVDTTLVSVNLVSYLSGWLNNHNAAFSSKNLNISKIGNFYATVSPPGMTLEYEWIFDTGMSPEITSSSIGSHLYNSTGQKSCTVTVRNSLGSLQSIPFVFYVVEVITTINVTENGNLLLTTSNYSVAVNQNSTFTVSSSQIVPDTERYLLRIKSGITLQASSVHPTIIFNFTQEQIYELSVAITNSLGTFTFTYPIEVITPLSGAYIMPPAGADGNMTLGSSITLVGGVYQGKYPKYIWSYSSAPPNESLPSTNTNANITVTPGSAGVYIVTLEVHNSASSPLKVNYTLNVMAAVSGVSINASLPFADSIQQGSSIVFTAMVTAGTGLSYYWEAIAVGMTTNTGYFQTFNVTFVKQALYNITLFVKNYFNNEVAYMEIFSLYPVPIFDVNVNGTTYVNSTNQIVSQTENTLTFYSTIANKDFITFDWTIDGISQGANKTLQHIFSTPALYKIVLNATNNISNRHNDLTVLVQDPLKNLSVSNCGGSFLLDIDITLEAFYDKGTDVIVSWSRDILGMVNGTITTARYSNIGMYNINVTANNYVSTETRYCQLKIQGLIKNLKLTHSQYLYVGYPVSFTVTGDNLNEAHFSWAFSNGSSQLTMVPYTDFNFTAAGTYNVEVIVSNDVSRDKVFIILYVVELACSKPVLAIDGIAERTVPRARAIQLAVSVTTNKCANYTSTNMWTVYEGSLCPVAQSNVYNLNNTIAVNTPILLLPKTTLPYGFYCIVYKHMYSNTPEVQYRYFNVTVVQSDLMALLTGGDEMVATEGNTLTLDASNSYDPDMNETALNYSWSCSMYSSSANIMCNSANTVTDSTATLTILTLITGDIYIVSVTVSATGRVSGNATQKIYIKASLTPVISIQCMSCVANGHNYLSRSKSVSIEGTCVSGCTSATVFKWTVTQTGTMNSPLTSVETQTTTGTSIKNLAIKDSVLDDGVGYTFKLEATEGSEVGLASISLAAGSIPIGGTCLLTPKTIVPLQDYVTVTCQNYHDADSMSGIYYKIMVSGVKDEYIAYYGTSPVNKIYVSPLSGTNSTAVTIIVNVLNDKGFSAHPLPLTETISFDSPILKAGQNNVDFIIDQIMSTMKTIVNQNNPVQLVQYCTAILNFLNVQTETGTGSAPMRMAIKDLIAFYLSGLSGTTIYDLQQTASAVHYLTMYPKELSTSTVIIVNSLIESMTHKLDSMVEKGQDQRNFQPDSLLNALSNMLLALQSPSTTISDKDIQATFSYLGFSATGESPGSSTTKDDMEAMIIQSMEFSTKLISVPLKTQLADEKEVIKTLSDNSTAFGKHVSVDKITKSIDGNGVKIIVPNTILSHTTYTDKSVFQLVTVGTTNPYNFGMSDILPLNTKSVSTSFLETNGKSISIGNLSEGNKVKMYMFDSSSTAYYTINNTGLVNSDGYTPIDNLNYTYFYMTGGKSYEFPVTLPVESGASVNIQIRPDYDVSVKSGSLDALLFKNGVAYKDTDANLYAHPLKITYVTMKELTVDHRKYTFYLPPGEIGTDDAFKVKVTSDIDVNVSVAIYYAKCEYFNVQKRVWDSEGCTPNADSIATVISCECDHMTSYGGSLIVSPDQISFTDLTVLDISKNPVAVITCSVVLGLYIILVFAFRRMDLNDVKRISLIPLCGKDGSFKFEVTIVTGRQPSAGTSARVGIRLIGEYGKSSRIHLNKSKAFQRNCSDTFIVAHDVNLGEPDRIQIWHDNSGMSPSWYLSHVIVNNLQTDKKYYFLADKWLSLEANGTIHTELKVANSMEMSKFGYRMKKALFSSLADKHLWLSLLNRPAESRFTRVQRVTCCVTILYVFIGVNAIWYGLLKTQYNNLGRENFGLETLVLALVSNIMVIPVSVALVFLFKKSRSKANLFAHIQKPLTAQTLEIENMCGISQGGSFESVHTGAVPYGLDRESTIDSVPQMVTGLHRSRHVAMTTRESTDDSIYQQHPTVPIANSSTKSPLWNEDGIMKWPEAALYGNSTDSRPSTSSTVTMVPAVKQPPAKAGELAPGAPGQTKEDAVQLLEFLDKLETDFKETESRSSKSHSGKKSVSLRRPTIHKSSWGSLEDIMNSDDESVPGSVKKQNHKHSKFSPRAEARIKGNERNWLKSRESTMSMSTGMNGSFAQMSGREITAGLRPGYFREMTIESKDIKPISRQHKNCTLPPWCIYIGYVLCFLLSAFSVILVLLYCFKFGSQQSTQWLLALILSLVISVLVIETLKAFLIAIFVVATFKSVQRDEDDDSIDIEPTYDNTNEKIKDVKFKPISGFALLQAKEESRRIHRMNVMIRQFIAYIFYLWLLLAIAYINFNNDSYLFTKQMETDFILPTLTNHKNFSNLATIEDFWNWTDQVFAVSLHLKDSKQYEEHGFLLGVASMRLIRSTTVTCQASNAAAKLGASSLTSRTCYGDDKYQEDQSSYGEQWNGSSYNLSWKYASRLGGTYKVGVVDTYGGGGYAQLLGKTTNETRAIIQNLKDKNWVDLRTRAVVLEFTFYSAGTDMTAMVALMVEFPLTGGVITSHEIQSQKLLWYQKNKVDPLMVLECILFLVTTYSVVFIALQIREKRVQFFKDVWNWYEMFTTLMTVASIGMYIGCVAEATRTFNNFLYNQSGVTSFEHVSYMHCAMRYLHAWLIFLLMFKVVKQLRFIKFMHMYEKTMSTAFGHLLGTGLIYTILLIIYAMVGYLMYGHVVSGFESIGKSIMTLLVIICGQFDFWPMLDHQPVFSHFYVYSYYSFAYGIMLGLVIAVLISTYRDTKVKMFFKSSLEMQDYEMIEFMMKRFKLWAGLMKPKPAFRRVHFPGQPSISSHSSSSYSNRISSSPQSSSSVMGPELSQMQLNSMMKRIVPTWHAILERIEKIEALDKDEENLVKRTEEEVKELKWKCRINQVEREHKELLSWKAPPEGSTKPLLVGQKHRYSLFKKLVSRDDKEGNVPAAVTGVRARVASSAPTSEEKLGQDKRPFSDQGARVEQPTTSRRHETTSGITDKIQGQKFWKSVKPSKSVWNK